MCTWYTYGHSGANRISKTTHPQHHGNICESPVFHLLQEGFTNYYTDSTFWSTNIAMENGTFRMIYDGLPIQNGDLFYSYVKFPQGNIPHRHHTNLMKPPYLIHPLAPALLEECSADLIWDNVLPLQGAPFVHRLKDRRFEINRVSCHGTFSSITWEKGFPLELWKTWENIS